MSLAALKLVLAIVVALHAPTHTPKVGTRWSYSVHATQNGKPVQGRLTETLLDPIGGSHPVTYAATTKEIADWPFTGTFRDYITWPGSSRGIPLRLRIVVVAGGVRKTITYAVTPRG